MRTGCGLHCGKIGPAHEGQGWEGAVAAAAAAAAAYDLKDILAPIKGNVAAATGRSPLFPYEGGSREGRH